jgi:hypothetical protein
MAAGYPPLAEDEIKELFIKVDPPAANTGLPEGRLCSTPFLEP